MDKMAHYTTFLCILLTYGQTQYSPYYQNPLHNYDHYNDMGPMENMYDDYEDSSECSCTCQICEDIKPCCRNVCVNCFQQSPSIVIVPYPYPLIISTKQKETTTQPQATEQTVATTIATPISTLAPVTKAEPKIETTLPTTVSTPEPTPAPEVLRHKDTYINDIIAKAPRINDRNKFVLTSLRRTKPNWMPKYGIVPIPDNLAEKLMLQLRSMRVLHPRKATFKPKDTISSLEKM